MENRQKLTYFIKNVKKQKSFSYKLDIVYMWVNMNDKKWQNKIKKYLPKDKKIDKLRYESFGEIYFSLKTIECFAKNICNNIYIVTDDQKLDSSKLSSWCKTKIKYIDHKDIIPKEYLPTFNSTTIETFLFKIPNLTPNFLFFNDDVFLGNELKLNFIFTNNVPTIMLNISYKQSKRSPDTPWVDWTLNAHDLFINKYNVFPNFRPVHTFHVINIENSKNVWKMFEKQLRSSITKFRESKNIIFWNLCYCVGLYNGVFKYKIPNELDSMLIYCQNYGEVDLDNFKNQIKKLIVNRPVTFCINNMEKKCEPMWNELTSRYLISHKSIIKDDKFLIFLSAPKGSGKSTKLKCITDLFNIQTGDKYINFDADEVVTKDILYRKEVNSIIKKYEGYFHIKELIDSYNLKGDCEKLDKLTNEIRDLWDNTIKRLDPVSKKNIDIIDGIKNNTKHIIVHTALWEHIDNEICGKSTHERHNYIHMAKRHGYKFILCYVYTELELAKERVTTRFLEQIINDKVRVPSFDKDGSYYIKHDTNIRKLKNVIESNCINRVVIYDNNNVKKDECVVIYDNENNKDLRKLPQFLKESIKKVYGGKTIRK